MIPPLLAEQFEPFILLDKTRVPDGYGGLIIKYTDGVTIQAAVILDDSTEARIGAVQGATDVYTIITSRAIVLELHDVIRRISDGQVFRVTNNGKDKATPKSADLDMRNVKAETWVIPSGGQDG